MTDATGIGWIIHKAPYLSAMGVYAFEVISQAIWKRSVWTEQRDLANVTVFLCLLFAFVVDGGIARLSTLGLAAVVVVRAFLRFTKSPA